MKREIVIDARAFRYYRQLGRVKQHLENRIEESLSLREAAGIAGMAECYFSAFFREKTGVTFKAWMGSERVRRAKELLRHPGHSITEVAYAVGFQDLRTFERVFKRLTKLTPSQYRNQLTRRKR